MFSKPQKDFTDEESLGRQSGSLAWRLARAEAQLETSKEFVIKPTPSEEDSMIIDISYDICKDVYVRKSNGDQESKGWASMASEVENLFKKEELDWKMVYLARKGKFDRFLHFSSFLLKV